MNSHDSSTDPPDRPGLESLLPQGQKGGVPAEPAAPPSPVDQVALRKLGGFNFITVGQWIELSREERTKLIRSDLVIFLHEGEEVPVREALLYMKSLSY